MVTSSEILIGRVIWIPRVLFRFTTPEELFGPVSVAGLKRDEYRRITTGKLIEAELVFLDEIFKASSAILNALLKIANERVFYNGGQEMQVPLISLFGVLRLDDLRGDALALEVIFSAVCLWRSTATPDATLRCPNGSDLTLHHDVLLVRPTNDDEPIAFEKRYSTFGYKVLDSAKQVFYKRSCFRSVEAQIVMKIKISYATLLTLASFTAGYAQTLDKAKLDQFFDRLAEKNNAMGSLTIAKDGNVLYPRAIGYSQINGTEKKPLIAANRYRVGSITKMFTAAMILQLVEEGRLKLTDTLDKFFPQVPNAQKITIAQILAHRSGIHDIFRDRNLRPSSQTNPITKDELLTLITKGKPDFEPGAKHSYSNSGYTLLGLIVEKLTGNPYGEALKKRITSKIGLKDTYIATGNIDVNKNESLTYRNLGGDWKQEPETHPSILFGAGSIVSTPNDLAKFIQALFDVKLISQESLASMKTIRDGDGLGMETFTFAGQTFYGHTGGGDNYGAWLAYLPEEKLAVAYTSNAKVYPIVNIVSGVIDIYYNKPFQIPAFDTIEVSPEVLDKYVGVYSSPQAPVKFTVTRDGETLFIQLTGQSAFPLEATAQDKFKIDPNGPVIEFDAANNQMTIKRSGGQRVFTKEN